MSIKQSFQHPCINLTKKMKIVVYGDIGGSGGYYNYCKGLFGSGAIPKDMLVYFVTSNNFHDKLGELDENVNVIKHNWIDSSSKIKRYLWHLFIYPHLVWKLKPDLEFYTSGQLRLFFRKALTLATCHNLLLFDDIELKRIKKKKEKKYFNNSKIKQTNSFKKSNALIFLSEHSKEVVLPKIEENKFNKIIAHGLNKEFITTNQRDYAFGKQVNILYVSPVFHYKNHLSVVKAFQELKLESEFNIHLNFVGGGKSSAADELTEYLKVNNLNDSITLKQYLNSSELVNEFETNDIFLFASSCETFGITLLEAMGSKSPIACSNRTGLPAILKDAGVYFDPFNVSSIKTALDELISNQDKREELGSRGYLYAQEYTWEKCAEETYEFIKKIINKKP